MPEPPALTEDAIVGALEASYDVRVADLAFLPVGNDSASWAYRVHAARGEDAFLKIRASSGGMPGAAVPAYLHRLGVPGVLAPRLTSDGEPYVVVDGFTLALYPLLDARVGTDAGLSPRQWEQLGAAVRQVHDVDQTPWLTRLVGRETFRPSRRELLPTLKALLTSARPADPVTRELAAFWTARKGVIDELVGRADVLGAQLARLRLPLVLCHADLHTWNVLVEADRPPWIVDWDEAVLAPRERDLMFVVGGIARGLVRERDTEGFLRGYGAVGTDPRLLAYYRTAWAVQDVAAFAEEAVLMPALGEQARREAVAYLVDLFAPGNIVDLANATVPAG